MPFSDPGIKPMSLKSPALAGGLFTTSATWEAFFLNVSTYENIFYPLSTDKEMED